MMNFYLLYGKRIFDLVFSSIGLILLTPVFLLISILIKLTSKGPIIFSQDRVGKGGRIFRLLKFRTMTPGAHHKGPSITQESDPRITKIGKFLRRTKMDELPQLINVLKGDMSMVGPRPEVPNYVKHFSLREKEVLKVRPGITGEAALRYRREESLLGKVPRGKLESFYREEILPRKLHLSLSYLEKVSFKRDLGILFKTLLLLSSRKKIRLPAREIRHLFYLFLDTTVLALSLIFSLYILYLGKIPHEVIASFPYLLFTAVITKISFFLILHLYDVSLWSFGLFESFTLFEGVLGGEFLFFALIFLEKSLYLIPNVQLLLVPVDFCLSLLLLGSGRISIRLFYLIKDFSPGYKDRILVVGKGPDAIGFVKQLIEGNGDLKKKPVGFLDVSHKNEGIRIYGVPVYSSLENLESVIKKTRAKEIVIAKSEASGKIREVVKRARKVGIRKVSVLPSILDILSDKGFSPRVRSLKIDDLLSREPVRINLKGLKRKFQDKRVLITGAAGSIGSELSWQITRLGAKRILLLDQEETNLHELYLSLKEAFPHKEIVPCLANILDEERIRWILGKENPHIVFHAAAYKHVPFLECNPEEAVKTNVLGSWTLARLAASSGVEKFIFISTDKAVSPTSIMGATKRVTEKLLIHLNEFEPTQFIIVRFGNVLGSRGSVTEIFKKQIENGGPVTITHPDMKRYFMTVSEAVLLTLEASLLGKGGEVFVLDMGSPVKILDLVNEMITLTGYEPQKDIPIVFMGPRPGEKLVERLFREDEGIEKTEHEQIYKARLSSNKQKSEWDEFSKKLRLLIYYAQSENIEGLFRTLKEIIPEYSPLLGEKQVLSEKIHSSRTN